MTATTTNSNATMRAFWRGCRDGAPFVLVVGPFAMLFGVLATEAGLDVLQTLSFSVVVVAGASQFTALQLMSENAPTVIVIASALAVNLRMAMYSAALTPWMGTAPMWQRAIGAYFILDQSYACASLEFERRPSMSVPQRMAYFIGTAAPVVPVWYACTVLGAVVGAKVPDSFALDFALPITFLALVAPMIRSLPHLVAAVVAVIVSLLAAGLPYSSGLLVAGLLAMTSGAQTEVWLERRRARDD